ncbi:MAG: hypothetical protein IPK16_14110 [Anaerolineales bacterium]|nr:hypothetical protein [Anaerolineales bacterium]
MRKRYPVVSFDLDQTLIFHTNDTKQAFVLSRLNELGYPATDKTYRTVMPLAREAYDVLGYRYAQNMAQLRHEYVRFILEGAWLRGSSHHPGGRRLLSSV